MYTNMWIVRLLAWLGNHWLASVGFCSCMKYIQPLGLIPSRVDSTPFQLNNQLVGHFGLLNTSVMVSKNSAALGSSHCEQANCLHHGQGTPPLPLLRDSHAASWGHASASMLPSAFMSLFSW